MKPTTQRRTRALRWLVLLAASLLPASGLPAQEAEFDPGVYLDRALDLMQEHSFRRELLDWEAIRTGAHERAARALTPADTYGAIRWALQQLGDRHSFLQVSEPAEDGGSEGETTEPELRVRREASGALIDAANVRIAHIGVPVISNADVAGSATDLHERLRELAEAAPCGWVVDLRGNSGGNMWPMLAGVGPLLGEGRHGAFLTVEGIVAEWFYEDGAAGTYHVGTGERRVDARIESEAVRLAGLPPVAVLTDGYTASSGEAVAIAFRGLPRSRSFGTPTYGVPTANQGFRLPDGANLVITTGADVDRDGNVYLDAITPDVVVESRWWQRPDDALDLAISWLIARPECSPPGARSP